MIADGYPNWGGALCRPPMQCAPWYAAGLPYEYLLSQYYLFGPPDCSRVSTKFLACSFYTLHVVALAVAWTGTCAIYDVMPYMWELEVSVHSSISANIAPFGLLLGVIPSWVCGLCLPWFMAILEDSCVTCILHLFVLWLKPHFGLYLKNYVS